MDPNRARLLAFEIAHAAHAIADDVARGEDRTDELEEAARTLRFGKQGQKYATVVLGSWLLDAIDLLKEEAPPEDGVKHAQITPHVLRILQAMLPAYPELGVFFAVRDGDEYPEAFYGLCDCVYDIIFAQTGQPAAHLRKFLETTGLPLPGDYPKELRRRL